MDIFNEIVEEKQQILAAYESIYFEILLFSIPGLEKKDILLACKSLQIIHACEINCPRQIFYGQLCLNVNALHTWRGIPWTRVKRFCPLWLHGKPLAAPQLFWWCRTNSFNAVLRFALEVSLFFTLSLSLSPNALPISSPIPRLCHFLFVASASSLASVCS